MTSNPERFNWALEHMYINPNNSILEIGCGAGILAELILEQLTAGFFTAIDRSAPFVSPHSHTNPINLPKLSRKHSHSHPNLPSRHFPPFSP